MLSLIHIFIPNYNGLKFMEPCMAALKGQTSQEFDVLVVDNGSTDGSAESVSYTHLDVYKRQDG